MKIKARTLAMVAEAIATRTFSRSNINIYPFTIIVNLTIRPGQLSSNRFPWVMNNGFTKTPPPDFCGNHPISLRAQPVKALEIPAKPCLVDNELPLSDRHRGSSLINKIKPYGYYPVAFDGAGSYWCVNKNRRIQTRRSINTNSHQSSWFLKKSFLNPFKQKNTPVCYSRWLSRLRLKQNAPVCTCQRGPVRGSSGPTKIRLAGSLILIVGHITESG